MSYLVLARKYRPQTFEEVVRQAHVTTTLTNAILAGRVAHAILFTGPRGTGKTTIARILAKAMNCIQGPLATPCNACRSCEEITGGSSADVFEIDGASNNSVDQVRELRENIKYMPAYSKFKIYIIDEVHMLSVAAFNALLKTLEEPPEHVLFLFATTEPHKIPITIHSRCQRHDLRRIDAQSLIAHMKMLCHREEREVSLESMGVIAREAGGSMRDALSLLDQVISSTSGPVKHEQLLDMLGAVDRSLLFELADGILKRDLAGLLDILEAAYNRGTDIRRLYAELVEHFRNLIVARMGKQTEKLIDASDYEREHLAQQARGAAPTHFSQMFRILAEEMPALKFATSPKLAFETVLFRIFEARPALPVEELIEKLDLLRKDFEQGGAPAVPVAADRAVPPEQPETLLAPPPAAIKEPAADYTPIQSPPAGTPAGTIAANGGDLSAIWKQLLECIAREHPALGGTLASAKLLDVTVDRVTLEVSGNQFNINRLRKRENSARLERICSDFFHRPVTVEVQADVAGQKENASKKKLDNKRKQDVLSHPLIEDAIEIFQGEVVEVRSLPGKRK
ncbi:MAG: DNA polymerase III subunit gamma/tau [Desulfobacterales bacterium]|nr:DNA polymerase III subunit gamma/tau [Desulfobacterales bacterium]